MAKDQTFERVAILQLKFPKQTPVNHTLGQDKLTPGGHNWALSAQVTSGPSLGGECSGV